MALDLTLWFNEKFLAPLCHYYTLENTIVYGIILCLAVLGTYKLLQKLKIKIDKRFFISLIPFIVYGGWTRALTDHGLYQGWWWCSPPIYFLIFAIALFSLLAGIAIQKYFRVSYEKTMLGIGLLLLIYNASLTRITNWSAFAMILGLISFWALLFFGVSHFKPKLVSKENAGITIAHLFDASSSFIAIQFFGYYEQHVLPSFLINLTGAWVMFPLKIFVLLPVLIIIDRECKDKFFRKFLKIIILILGLALGVRDFLTISMI